MNPIDINFTPFIQDLKNLFEVELNTEKPGVTSRALEQVEETKEIVIELAQGILDKQLTADFVVKRLKEIPENLVNYLRSEGIIQVANAERIAKEVSYKLLNFLNNEVLAKIKSAVDSADNDSE